MVRSTSAILLCAMLFLAGCGSSDDGGGQDASAARSPASLDQGLLLALAQFEVTPEGKVLPKPKPALLEILTRQDGEWKVTKLEDPDSNVFHKAMVYTPPSGETGILTLGGNAAAVKLWHKGPTGFESETLWMAVFGGKHNRMRDAEAALTAALEQYPNNPWLNKRMLELRERQLAMLKLLAGFDRTSRRTEI